MKVEPLKTVSSGSYTTTDLNDNFTKIREAFENTLSRDGSIPNHMDADLDMNSNDILNVNTLYLDNLFVNGNLVQPGNLVVTGALLAGNNLSDVLDVIAARTNLGIQPRVVYENNVRTAVLSDDNIYLVATASITLNLVNFHEGYRIALKARDGSIQINAPAGQNIDNNPTVTLPKGSHGYVVQDASGDWTLVSDSVPFIVDDIFTDTTGPQGVGTVWQSGSHRYVEADPAATDHHVTNAATPPVKFYVEPEESGFKASAFGVVADGVTNDSASVLNCIRAAVQDSNAAVFPGGDILLGTPVSMTVLNEHFSVSGAGDMVTRFIVPASNTSGGILLGSLSRAGTATFENFSVIRRGQGGTGLSYTQPEGGSQHKRAVILRNVSVRSDNMVSDRFDTGIDLSGSWRPLLDNVTCTGPSIGANNSNSSPKYQTQTGIDLTGCYSPAVRNSHVFAAHTAIRADVSRPQITGFSNQGGGVVRVTTSAYHPFSTGALVRIVGTANYNGDYNITRISDTEFDITVPYNGTETGTCFAAVGPEGMWVVDSVMNHCRIGLDYRRPAGREPQLMVSGCHVNARDAGLYIDGAKYFQLTKNLMYNHDTGNDYAGISYDFLLPGVSEGIIDHNVFGYNQGSPDRINIAVITSSGAPGVGDALLISNNLFAANSDVGVWLGTNCDDVIVNGNVFSGTFNTNRIVDNSGRAEIREPLAETAGSWTPEIFFGGSNAGITYSLQEGTYRLSDGVLEIDVKITLTSKGTATGNAEISIPTNLPGSLAVTTLSGSNVNASFYAGMSGISSHISCRVLSPSRLRFVQHGPASVVNLTDNNFSNNTNIRISGSIMLK